MRPSCRNRSTPVALVNAVEQAARESVVAGV